MTEVQNSRAVLFERGSVLLEKSEEPSEEVVKFLAETVWGTPGGTLFRHLDTQELIHLLVKPHYINCYRRNELIAVLSFCQRTSLLNGQASDAYYIHHLAFHEKFRIKGSKNKKSDSLMANPALINPKSWIKQSMLNLFENPQVVSQNNDLSAKAVFYAFIEAENTRSLQMATGFGFQKIRRFSTLPFSRLKPKGHPNVFRIEESEKEQMLKALEVQYQDHTLFFTDHIFLKNNYFVFKHKGEIVAGVQAMPVQWAIQALPGLSGKITMKVLPLVPLISRLFNPKKFTPAIFEGIFFKEGHEQHLIELLEAVLEKMKLNTALIWLDNQSPLYKLLRNSKQLGLLDKLQEESQADVIARFVNYSQEEIAQFQHRPVYLSAFDLT